MLYDISLTITYAYDAPVAGGRHHVRVLPRLNHGQRVVASSLFFDPPPAERSDIQDFFGNSVTGIAFRNQHDQLKVRMTARVDVDRSEDMFDMSPGLDTLVQEMAEIRSIAPDSPHHFISPSARVALSEEITAYARQSFDATSTVRAAVIDFCHRIHADFTYDPEATEVETPAFDAFRLKRGVCQDFAHVMIAGLRGVGVPAGYVSGFLRTIPPSGKERLEGADAMHAWVRAWCGAQTGWLELDPTNALVVGNDHISVAHGRDYQDVAPIVGVLKTIGDHETSHAVDVVPVG